MILCPLSSFKICTDMKEFLSNERRRTQLKAASQWFRMRATWKAKIMQSRVKSMENLSISHYSPLHPPPSFEVR